MSKNKTKKVDIYSTKSCKYCKDAKEFFKRNNISYTEHDVGSANKDREEMVEKSGQMGVPVIIVDGEVIVGYEEAVLKDLLGVK